MTPFNDLLGAARAGAEPAWSHLYREYAPKVAGYLRARGAPDVEDLVGEVFLQAVRDLHRFDGAEPDFRAWLFTVAHHRLIDDARWRSRRPQLVAESESTVAIEQIGDVEQEAMRALSEQQIREILDRLSEDQQSVLLLRLFAGMTASQIAEALGKNIGAVKALQHRAVAAVRRLLEHNSFLLEPEAAMQGER